MIFYFGFADCLGEGISEVARDIEAVELNYPSQRWERYISRWK